MIWLAAIVFVACQVLLAKGFAPKVVRSMGAIKLMAAAIGLLALVAIASSVLHLGWIPVGVATVMCGSVIVSRVLDGFNSAMPLR